MDKFREINHCGNQASLIQHFEKNICGIKNLKLNLVKIQFKMSAKPDKSNRPAQPSQAQEDGQHKQPMQAQLVQGQPIQKQPTQVQPMQAPIMSQPMEAAAWTGDCPPGLQHLSQLNKIWIKREMNNHWLAPGRVNDKYQILNAMGQQIYKVKEESTCCTSMCVPLRTLNVMIKDNSGQEVSQLFGSEYLLPIWAPENEH